MGGQPGALGLNRNGASPGCRSCWLHGCGSCISPVQHPRGRAIHASAMGRRPWAAVKLAGLAPAHRSGPIQPLARRQPQLSWPFCGTPAVLLPFPRRPIGTRTPKWPPARRRPLGGRDRRPHASGQAPWAQTLCSLLGPSCGESGRGGPIPCQPGAQTGPWSGLGGGMRTNAACSLQKLLLSGWPRGGAAC